MRIAMGSDHGGYSLKEYIGACLRQQGVETADLGAYNEAESDYPDFALAVAEAVAGGQCDLGIVVCGTGIGVSITANKVRGVRAALCHDPYSARMAREHNNANVLALGERVIGRGLAMAVVEAFLAASFAGRRHARRVDRITAVEANQRDKDKEGRDVDTETV